LNPLAIHFTSTFIHSLGWTILHSLWQITIVSAIYGILLLFLKRSSSALRYYFSAAFLLVILFISIITFCNEYSIYNKEVLTTQSEVFENVNIELTDNQIIDSNTDNQLAVKEQFMAYIENNLSLIVAIWNFVILFLLLKMLGGLVYAQRLKSYKTSNAPASWNARLKQLSKSIGINRNIQLLESAIVKVPMVIGFFKPVILLPLGIISGLTTDQLEAILAHELAHIKRNDYLVNVFQTIIEVLFFFHPAIWWISKNIREERENACDDIAISIHKNGIALAKALAKIEILNHNKSTYAMALNGNKTSLINRIKRLVNQQKTSFTLKEGLFTACILVASLIAMSFSTQAIIKLDSKQNISEKIEPQIENSSTAELYHLVSNSAHIDKTTPNNISLSENKTPALIEDTIVLINQDKEVIYKVNGIYYKVNLGNDKMLEKFSINEKEIPNEDWDKYQNVIGEALSYLNENRNLIVDDEELRFQSEELKLQGEKLKLQSDELKLQSERLKTQNEKLNKEIVIITLRDQARRDSAISLTKEEVKQRDIEFYHEVKKVLDEQEKLHVQQAMINKERTKLGEERKKFSIEKEKLRKQEQLLKEQENKKNEQEKSKILNELVEEMKNDKLIDRTEIAYKVHFFDSYLEINEERQSNEVFQKYKRLFDEKSKGRFELDYQLNVNPNFYYKK